MNERSLRDTPRMGRSHNKIYLTIGPSNITTKTSLKVIYLPYFLGLLYKRLAAVRHVQHRIELCSTINDQCHHHLFVQHAKTPQHVPKNRHAFAFSLPFLGPGADLV